MLTIEKLKEFGADTDAGLARCMGSEALYLRLVAMAKDEKNFDKLKEALEGCDLDRAFEAAHALKGVMRNLSPTKLFELSSDITEHLRARESIDYSAFLTELLDLREELRKICE